MLNTLAWQHVKRRRGVRWSGELRIEKSHLQRSSLSADLRPQRSASTSERGWLPQPRSHAVARTPYSSPHFGPSRRSDLSQNMICPGSSEICPAPLLSLSKHARKFKKRKKRKYNGEKKRALRKTRIYNYYVPTKRSRCKAQVTPHCGKARWRRCGSARHRFTAQNFGIRTLDAARDCRIPTSDLFRWLKAQSNSTASS